MFIPHPRHQYSGLFGKYFGSNGRKTTDHKVHMTVIVTISGSAFGMARAAANTAATLRVPIPSAMTLR